MRTPTMDTRRSIGSPGRDPVGAPGRLGESVDHQRVHAEATLAVEDPPQRLLQVTVTTPIFAMPRFATFHSTRLGIQSTT